MILTTLAVIGGAVVVVAILAGVVALLLSGLRPGDLP